jgi:hypothetical protein
LNQKRNNAPGFALALAAFACALLVAGSGVAQESRPEPPAAVQAPAPPANQPGFMDAMGRWLEQGAAKLKTDMENAQETLGKLGTERQNRDRARAVRHCGEWRARLSDRCGDPLPREGLCDRQKPRYRIGAEVQYGPLPARGPLPE